MRKLLMVASFFVVTPLFLLFSVLLVSFLKHNNSVGVVPFSLLLTKHQIAYAAIPAVDNLFSEQLAPQDAREEIIRQFFAKYGSPLEPYAKHIVEAADTHGLDFRLLPAIAMQESNLCKKIPTSSHNCWGFGIYGKTVTRFASYPEAIEAVSRTLAKEYKGKGFHTPEEIMRKYTPSSNGSWARAVTHFMEQLQ